MRKIDVRAETLDAGFEARPMERDVRAAAPRKTSHLVEAQAEAAIDRGCVETR